MQVASARTHESHCKCKLQVQGVMRVIASASFKCKDSRESLQVQVASAMGHGKCKLQVQVASASCTCKLQVRAHEIDLRGVKISSSGGGVAPTTLYESRPFAGTGMVEVQKLEFVFYDLQPARATLCGDRRGRGAKTRGFFWRFLRRSRNPLRGSGCVFCGARATLRGDRRGRGAKTQGFLLRSLRCLRDPLRGSAWPRCKNPMFCATFAVRAGRLVVRAPAPGTGGRASQANAVSFKHESSTRSPLPQLELENRKS